MATQPGRMAWSSHLPPRSNACYYEADLTAFPGQREGRGPRRRTEQHWMHGFQHLAKVRVAGSNPVVRSKNRAVLAGLNGAGEVRFQEDQRRPFDQL